MPTWYENACFLLHLDHPFDLIDEPPAMTGLEADQIRRLLERTRPDAVHYTIKGLPGYVPYETRYANGVPWCRPSPPPDLPAIYRDVTRELGIRLIFGFAGLTDRHAGETRPEWLRVDVSGAPYPNRALCPNNGYVEELMLPQLDELVTAYAPDGLWLDGENWTVSPCYCNACATEYQLLHRRSAPTGRRDPHWRAWLQFHRDSFQRYVERVGRFLHDRASDLVYATNAGYCTHQPEPLPAGPDRLTWDLSPAYSLRQAVLEAAYLSGRGTPFDLCTRRDGTARPSPRGGLPALPRYPRPLEQLVQEGATILSHGGRWALWLDAYADDALPEDRGETLARAAAFAVERAPWCLRTRSDAGIAVLHSAETHRRAGNGLYDPGPSLDRVRGADQVLHELHLPHDVVDETGLKHHLDRYQVLVLPEQIALDRETERLITGWVRAGGRLVASGRVAPEIENDLPSFAFSDVLGIVWTGRREEGGYFLHRGQPLRIEAPVYPVTLDGAEVLRPLLAGGHEWRQEDLGHPAVTRHALGEGEGYYVAADLFAAYHRYPHPLLREVIGDVLGQALPHPPLTTTAPPTVTLIARRRGETWLLQLLNHAAGNAPAPNQVFVESVPPAPPFELRLRLPGKPASVRLQPDDVEPEWSFDAGALTVTVPGLPVHATLVIEPGEAPEPAPAEAATPDRA